MTRLVIAIKNNLALDVVAGSLVARSDPIHRQLTYFVTRTRVWLS